MKKANSHTNESQPIDNIHSTADGDRRSILKHLIENVRMTTLQAREELGVMSPAPRVLELRRMGHKIVTHRRYDRDITGRNHYQAEYILMSSGRKESTNV